MPRVIGLYGLSGSGKTSQSGEYAKRVKRLTGKRTKYFNPDFGGHDSIDPLVRRGIVEPHYLNPGDNPFEWLNAAVSDDPGDDIGLVVYDSGLSITEAMLGNVAALDAQGLKIGAKAAAPARITSNIILGANNETHYGLIHTFFLDSLHKSTWLARKYGVDIIWTFGEHRGEDTNTNSIIGPKIIGKALTGILPKEVQYMLRLVERPVEGEASRHVLMTQAQPELGGVGMCFANARYPLDADTPLPALIEPASLNTFFDIIEQGQAEADRKLEAEGL